jgi:hypothetical protein
MLSLIIHHNIHLNREQRYALHDGKDVQTVGISIPVWYYKNMTSEPAREVFCNYYLKNPKKDVPIEILKDGYEISIPYREGIPLNISNEDWRILNIYHPEKLQQLYSQTVEEVSSKNLLDVKDGGSGWLTYREHNKVKIGNKLLNIMHFVCISTIESLIESIC